MFKVMRSNRTQIDISQIFDLHTEKKHLKRCKIARLLLSFRKSGSLSLMAMS